MSFINTLYSPDIHFPNFLITIPPSLNSTLYSVGNRLTVELLELSWHLKRTASATVIYVYLPVAQRVREIKSRLYDSWSFTHENYAWSYQFWRRYHVTSRSLVSSNIRAYYRVYVCNMYVVRMKRVPAVTTAVYAHMHEWIAIDAACTVVACVQRPRWTSERSKHRRAILWNLCVLPCNYPLRSALNDFGVGINSLCATTNGYVCTIECLNVVEEKSEIERHRYVSPYSSRSHPLRLYSNAPVFNQFRFLSLWTLWFYSRHRAACPFFCRTVDISYL